MKNHNNPPTTPVLPRRTRLEDAVFIGWQKISPGKAFPLYNVTAVGHPAYGSTVTDQGLHKLNLEVPRTPPLQKSAKATPLEPPAIEVLERSLSR